MFSPTGVKCPTQAEFQAWLRLSFKTLLQGPRAEVQALVNAITPHSFRAGLASDLEREGVPRRVIMKRGRWNSAKAMEQYARDGLAQRLRSCSFNKIDVDREIHVQAMATAEGRGC